MRQRRSRPLERIANLVGNGREARRRRALREVYDPTFDATRVQVPAWEDEDMLDEDLRMIDTLPEPRALPPKPRSYRIPPRPRALPKGKIPVRRLSAADWRRLVRSALEEADYDLHNAALKVTKAALEQADPQTRQEMDEVFGYVEAELGKALHFQLNEIRRGARMFGW